MPQFSVRSKKRLKQCDPRLQKILNHAIKEVDFTILCGHRNEEDQNEAYRTGKSTKRWPQSKHNKKPSLAVDVAPWFGPQVKIDWDDLLAFARLAGYFEAIADHLGIRIRWGADWNENGRSRDERFIDAGHFELID